MAVSSMSRIVIDRGTKPRARVGAFLVHTTGTGIIGQAQAAGQDPNRFAGEKYKTLPGYPHYLILRDGEILSYCDELKTAAHAKWSDWEKTAYQDGSWKTKFAKDFNDDVVDVAADFYRDWDDTWGPRGYKSPLDILTQVGSGTSPNAGYIGVELLAPDKSGDSFTPSQHVSLAKLFADVADRHNLLNGALVEAGTLPQAWFCGHSDVGPCRRWQRHKDGSGYGWDPGSAINWRVIEQCLTK